ncbi:hypothetical protein BS47DRAFT_1483567 [Hydnum rufescens UP504]|uniref:Fungal lipase-type domain-containing protein n=1 Tax=Hydnum rufescens UP504 TaxID=1448309 RepID=A0A9P6B3Z8_9AGAM|nr:hypothetical protein BS47DRAFT_1483567 [Hydnum rufescens UP504]
MSNLNGIVNGFLGCYRACRNTHFHEIILIWRTQLQISVPNGPPSDNPSSYDDDKISEVLQKLRADEIRPSRRPNFLARFLFRIPVIRSPYLYIKLVITETWRYFYWLFITWKAAFLYTWDSMVHPPKNETRSHDTGDWLAYMLFALLGTVVLPFFLALCLVARFPPITRTYSAWTALFGGDLGIINASNPNLFKSLTVRQAQVGTKALGLPPEDTGTDTTRHFNFDIAKLLLQFASVIYEHSNDAVHNAAFGGLDFFGRDFGFLESPGDAIIRGFCRQFGIQYQPVSELNNTSSAFAAAFWDPSSTWVVLALKGTTAVEFGDWVSDLDARMVDCAHYIPGFQRVHRGFKERVFPDKGRQPWESQDQRPYNTISKGLQHVVHKLSQRHGGKQINVWFTGHSLGCATATLIYSRMLMNPKEVGDNGILRDAYLFAAPIVGDPQSVTAFNDRIFKKDDLKRTMWRITSNDDFVATGLPEYGDYLYISDPNALKTDRENNLFFSHFGSEIVLYDYPYSSNVTGNHLRYNHKVVINSAFTRKEVAQFQGKKMSKFRENIRVTIRTAIQQIPLIGRFIAHFPPYYWDQLDRIALGECEWTVY